MRAYFDNNIFVEIELRNTSTDRVIKSIDPRITSIYFSAAHLQEAEEITGESDGVRLERITRRLDTLEMVTECNYVNENLSSEVFFLKEHPSVVLETIRDVPMANDFMKSFVSIISDEQKQSYRNQLGVDPIKINNYSPEEVVDQLNIKLKEVEPNLSFLEMIEHSISFHPQGATFGISHRMAAIFELLDMIGYWKDKSTPKSNYARLWDSNHAFYAAHCAYFVSDDKRTRFKSQVAYHLLNVGTKVVSSKG
jgi:hypothetical protein